MLPGRPPHAPAASDEVNAALAATAHRTWLERLWPGLFGIPLGLLGLAGAWRRLAQSPDLPGLPGSSAAVATGLATLGTAVWALLFVLWTLKWLRHRDRVRSEWRHPVQGSLLALWPVSTMLVVAYFAPSPALHPGWYALALGITLLALVMQLSIAWQVVSQLTTGQTPAELVSPALYMPVVPGGFVGAMALNALGLPGWAVLLFGMGLGGWALLEVRILHRLFAGPLPIALRPTMGLEIAPAAVGALAMSVLWPQLPADVLLLAQGITVGPVLAVLARWHWWSAAPFSAGFWSFSFPVAAIASVTVESVRRGGWPALPAWVAVAVASAVIGYLALRTLALLRAGTLLPRS